MAEGIVVRVISDKYANGSLYNKKVQIKSIMNQYQFLASQIGSQQVYSDLREKDIETVVPQSHEFAIK